MIKASEIYLCVFSVLFVCLEKLYQRRVYLLENASLLLYDTFFPVSRYIQDSATLNRQPKNTSNHIFSSKNGCHHMVKCTIMRKIALFIAINYWCFFKQIAPPSFEKKLFVLKIFEYGGIFDLLFSLPRASIDSQGCFTYTIVDHGVYNIHHFRISYSTFLLPIKKSFLAIKECNNLSYMQSFRQINLKQWKIGAIQNRYPIVVYGVMSDRESKNPRPL